MASVRSLDNALEVSQTVMDADGLNQPKITGNDGRTHIPDNGRLMRNLIEGADTVMSHITHFYQLSALDFVDASDLGPFFSPGFSGTAMIPGTFVMLNGNSVVDNYVEALVMRRKTHTLGAILSGRQPIQNAIVPGGVTTLPTASDMDNFDSLLTDIRSFINTAYVPDVLTVAVTAPVVLSGTFGTWLQYWNPTGPLNAISYGAFPCQSGTNAEDLLIARGVATAGTTPADINIDPTTLLDKIIEDTKWSYYDVTQAQGLHPFAGKTNPDVSLVGGTQYSWLKAPRYTGSRTVCEVGPLARMVVSYLAGASGTPKKAKKAGAAANVAFAALTDPYSAYDIANATLGLMAGYSLGAANLYSTFGRHACRMIECKLVADAMATWSDELKGTSYAGLTNPSYVYAKLPTKPAKGSGWTEAPRGALGHWITIEKKKIVNYQCVVPTTWNHGPRDDADVEGPAEQVILDINVGANASTEVQELSIIRALHPFDFCIACAVHLVRPDGSTISKFRMESDGKITRLPHDAEI